jgi:hypothetical protein
MSGITREVLEKSLSDREKENLLPLLDKHFPSAIVNNRQRLAFIKALDSLICEKVILARSAEARKHD